MVQVHWINRNSLKKFSQGQGRQSVLKSEGDRLENEEVRGYMFP